MIMMYFFVSVVECAFDQFSCDTGFLGTNSTQCIDALWVCDGFTDCFNGADESNCTSIGEQAFLNQFKTAIL